MGNTFENYILQTGRMLSHDTFHRVAGYARRPCDVPLAEAEMLQPEDFAVFGHVTSIGKTVATLRRAIPL